MIEEGDQKQDHENAGERRSQPSDEGGVIAAGMRDDRGDEPQCQRDEGDGRYALHPPVFDPLFRRAEAHGASQGRAHALTVHRLYPATNKLTTQAAMVSATLVATTTHPET